MLKTSFCIRGAIFSLYLVAVSLMSFAQKKIIYKDSIENIISSNNVDTTKINSLLGLIEKYSSEENDLNKYVNIAIKNICISNFDQHSDHELIVFFEERFGWASSGLASYYIFAGRLDDAIKEYKLAANYAVKEGDYRLLAIVNQGLGRAYQSFQEFEQALYYYRECERIVEAHDLKWETMATKGGIASVYYYIHEHDTLTPAYFDTIYWNYYDLMTLSDSLISKATDNKVISDLMKSNAITYGNMGLSFYAKKNFEKVVGLAKKGYRLSDSLNYNVGKVFNLRMQFIAYLGMGDLELAIEKGERALSLAKQNDFLGEISYIHEVLHDAYKKKKNFKMALFNYEGYIVARDSFASENNQKAIIQQVLELEYDKKALSDSLFYLEEKRERQLELEKKEFELNEASNRQVALMIILVLIFIFAIIIFRALRQNRKAKEIISSQKMEVEANRQKILDSINYAQKIQASLLPSAAEIKSYLPGFANLNLPKDVVSGDFYWFHSENSVSYMAVSDCTGHGVPGAFMSIIGATLLKKYIKDLGISDLSLVLEKMDEEIIELLSQYDFDASEDGMDIGIVKINHKANSLRFSGARQNLYIANEKGIEEVKGTMRGIGGWVKKRHKLPIFEEKELSLENISTLYLCTDGFEDQFGEGTQVKFGRERMNDLMNKVQTNLDMDMLKDAFMEWKGSEEQMDDVSLVAIKLKNNEEG